MSKLTRSSFLLSTLLLYSACQSEPKPDLHPLVKTYSHQVRTANGVTFCDLNKNGQLDVYEDPRQPLDARVEDVLAQMTLEEKAGMLFIDGAGVYSDGSLTPGPGKTIEGPAARRPPVTYFTADKKLTHFNFWQTPPPPIFAKGANAIQQYAQDSTRLGIPVTLATEPRWPRNAYTFGEDAELVSKMVEQYILGFQGNSLSDPSVACMTKHFPGGGSQKEELPHDSEKPLFPFGFGL